MSGSFVCDRALVLAHYKYQENALIVVFLSRNHGLLRAMLKKTHGSKSATFGIDLLQEVDLVWKKARSSRSLANEGSSVMVTVVEHKMLQSFAGLRSNYAALLAAGYFSKLCLLAGSEGQGDEQLYDLLWRAWNYLCGQSATVRIVAHFEKRLLQVSGFFDATSQLGHERQLAAHFATLMEHRTTLLRQLKPS